MLRRNTSRQLPHSDGSFKTPSDHHILIRLGGRVLINGQVQRLTAQVDPERVGRLGYGLIDSLPRIAQGTGISGHFPSARSLRLPLVGPFLPQSAPGLATIALGRLALGRLALGRLALSSTLTLAVALTAFDHNHGLSRLAGVDRPPRPEDLPARGRRLPRLALRASHGPPRSLLLGTPLALGNGAQHRSHEEHQPDQPNDAF